MGKFNCFRKNQKEKVSADLKKRVAQVVKGHPCLWQKTDAGYRKKDVKIAAWDSTLIEINESGYKVELGAIKSIWKSLLDALRYQQTKKPKPGKSGDSLEDAESDQDFSDAQLIPHEHLEGEFWEFYDDMKFLLEEAPSRTTISTLNDESSIKNTVDLSHEPIVDAIEVEADQPSETIKETPSTSFKRTLNAPYCFEPARLKGKRARLESTSDDRIADSLQSLVELRKATVTNISESSQTQQGLKFYSMFLNLDRMLQKLSEEDVEDLNFEFISLTRDRIKTNCTN